MTTILHTGLFFYLGTPFRNADSVIHAPQKHILIPPTMLNLPIPLLFLLILTLSASIPSVLGGVYPTYPIADTTWSGGTMESLTWIDDGTPPKLEELGKLDVELYVGEVRFTLYPGIFWSVGWLVDG